MIIYRHFNTIIFKETHIIRSTDMMLSTLSRNNTIAIIIMTLRSQALLGIKCVTALLPLIMMAIQIVSSRQFGSELIKPSAL